MVADAELDDLNKKLEEQADALLELEERVKLEMGAREHAENKIQEMRREKEQLNQIIQEHTETAEAFQERLTYTGKTVLRTEFFI